MRRLPPLNALRAFEATARLSSITAAAQELGVTHSAISQHVRQLETYMGRRLFNRPGRRVEPTPAGHALLQDVTAAFDQIASASERLTHRGARRVLTVNAPAFFALRWLVPRMAQFQKRHQGLELRVETAACAATVRPDRTYAALICREQLDWPDFVCRPLLEERRTVIMAPQLATQHQLTRPADLAHLTRLHTRSEPAEWQHWFEHFGEGNSPRSSEGPMFDNEALALEAALTGLGAAIAPVALVAGDLAQGRLIAPFPAAMLQGRGFFLLYHQDDALQRGPRELLRWLDQESNATARAAHAQIDASGAHENTRHPATMQGRTTRAHSVKLK